jgi:hypothetical protein
MRKNGTAPRLDRWEEQLEPAPIMDIGTQQLRARKPIEPAPGVQTIWGRYQVGFLVREARSVWSRGISQQVSADFFHLKGFSNESQDKAIDMAKRACGLVRPAAEVVRPDWLEAAR